MGLRGCDFGWIKMAIIRRRDAWQVAMQFRLTVKPNDVFCLGSYNDA